MQYISDFTSWFIGHKDSIYDPGTLDHIYTNLDHQYLCDLEISDPGSNIKAINRFMAMGS